MPQLKSAPAAPSAGVIITPPPPVAASPTIPEPQAAPVIEADLLDGQTLEPAPSATGVIVEAQRERIVPADYEFLVYTGKTRAPSMFIKTVEELNAEINKLPVSEQAKVVVFKRLPVKVETKVTFF